MVKGGGNGMSQQRAPAGARRGAVRDGRQARLLLAAGLLALVAVGLRVSVRPPALNGPFRHDGLLVGAVLEAVLAGLMAALLVRGARAPRAALLAARLRWLLRYVVGLGLVAIPVAYLLSRQVHLKARPRPRTSVGSHRAGAVRPGHPGSFPVVGLIVVIIVGALLAAVLIYLIARLIALRGAFWAGWRRRAGGLAIADSAGDDESGLAEALESGQSALRRLDDARAAIIACYVAMEQSLARAGTARAAADTPDELLARAAGSGLVTGDAAARLTGLFYEARFSSHPLPPRARDTAERALGDLAASLTGRPAAGTGAAPR